VIRYNKHQQAKAAHPIQELRRPEYPFSSPVCAIVATLPLPFEELCFEHLVEPLIELLGRINEWACALTSNRNKNRGGSQTCVPQAMVDENFSNSIALFVLMQHPELPTRDQLVVMAMKGWCALMDQTETNRYLHRTNLELHADMISPTLVTELAGDQRNVNWLTWVAMLLLASSHIDARAWSLGMRILDGQEFQKSWEQRLAICKNFFWDTEFSSIVLQKVNYSTVKCAQKKGDDRTLVVR
jgi:hypothetical protein